MPPAVHAKGSCFKFFFLKLEFSFRDLVQNGENYWLLCETNMVLLSDMFDNQAHYLQGSLTP